MNPDSRSVGCQSVRGFDFGFRRIQRGNIKGTIIVPACIHACLALPTGSCKLLKIRLVATFESYSAHHLFSAGCGDSVRKLQPTIQPTNKNGSLDHLRRESHFPEERPLRGLCFIAVALRVEIQRCLDA
jgi:hypothetical protein